MRSATKRFSTAELAQRAIAHLAAKLSPKGLLQVLRPAELDYLCEVCELLEELRLCDVAGLDWAEELPELEQEEDDPDG